MSLLSWFRGQRAAQSKDQLASEIFTLLAHGWQVPPRRGTAALLLSVQTQPWLGAVLRRIAQGVAMSLEWRLYDRPLDDERKQRIPQHPILDLLRNPCSQIPRAKFWEVLVHHRKLCGEGFLIVDPSRSGRRPALLTPMPPHLVKSIPNKNDPRYEITPYEGTPWHQFYGADQVIHVRDPDPYDPLGRGLGPGGTLNELIGIMASALQSVNGFFANGMLPDFIVSLGAAQTNELMAFKKQLQEEYGGPKKSHRAHFTNRAMQVQRLDTSFRDMELLGVLKYSQDVVTQIFGVPPEIMGMISNSNRSTIEAADYHMMKYVIYPECCAIRDELQMGLVPLFGGRLVYLDVVNPIPSDKEFGLRCVTAAPSAFTKGEVRQMAGLPPGDEADEPLQSAPKVTSPEQTPDTQENNPPDKEEPEDDEAAPGSRSVVEQGEGPSGGPSSGSGV